MPQRTPEETFGKSKFDAVRSEAGRVLSVLTLTASSISRSTCPHGRASACSAIGRVNTLRFFSQLHPGIAGPDDVSLHSAAHMSQFAHETSGRVCIQELRCVAEFWHITEERAEDGFCKGSAARTLAHAALTLSNADRCVAFSPLYSVELARLRVHAFVDCGLGPPQKGNCDVPVAQTAQSVTVTAGHAS